MSVIIVSDLGYNDLAGLEVRNKIKGQLPHYDVEYISTNPFNTIEGGFILGQMILNNQNNRYYVNIAPRKDDLGVRSNNSGEKLCYAFINKNVIVGVNAGFVFSYLKNYGTFYELNCDSNGSQFRSRDVFPKMFGDIYEAGSDLAIKSSRYLKGVVCDISDMPNDKIMYVDHFGNLKINNALTEEQSNVQKLHIRIQGKAITVNNTKGGMFSVPDGEFALAEGSSGWDGKRFLEISLRGGSAAKYFDNPLPGTKVNIDIV